MATNPIGTNVTVGSSALPATITAALRYVLSLVCTFAVARGWVNPENVDGIITAAVLVITVGYGLWRTWKKQGALIDAAPYAPNITKVQ